VEVLVSFYSAFSSFLLGPDLSHIMLVPYKYLVAQLTVSSREDLESFAGIFEVLEAFGQVACG
jgi:hypothetical protein